MNSLKAINIKIRYDQYKKSSSKENQNTWKWYKISLIYYFEYVTIKDLSYVKNQ